jgi:hypothetical protein
MEPSGGKKWKKHENDGKKGDLWDEILVTLGEGG